MARARKQPIPITIVTGTRGAGKTTLINRLLGDEAFANTAVILNDFGEVALRSAVVEKAEDGFIALGSGCVCCTVRGALTDGLEKLLRDLDNGRIAAISRVVIEADAAADPAAIFAAVARHPYLSLRFVADGIVTVIAAATAEATLAVSAEVARQVAMADLVAVSRAGADDATLRGLLRQLNPHANIVDAATVAPLAVVDHGAFDPVTGNVEAWLGVRVSDAAPVSLRGEAARIRVFSVLRERPIPMAALERFIGYLSALQGANLIRVRGVVATGKDEAVIVEGAGGFFEPPLIVDGMAAAPTRFIVIGRDLDRATFEAYLDAFLNEARIDTPDRQALADNPLAIPGFSARSGR